ncbi:hypothetical protein HYW74_00885 [Candidatus Pacearchaeota archaeon]|nr:hypothetical protein [Candidatus Pacearchaeota archaeon]
MEKYLIISLLITLSIFSVSATQVCETYDNFSSESLNTNKWIEIDGGLDEFGVNESEGVYHTAQFNQSDKRVTLQVNRIFIPGDIIEYDVNYINGSGNRRHTINVDGISDSWSLFGFWNTISDGGVGNDFGLYHIKINFTEQGVSDKIILPNGTIVFTIPDGKLPSPGSNHSFGLVTSTGHNGIVHMDYDNVVICLEQQEPTDLEVRLTELEGRVNELEDKINLLEELINNLKSYFFFMPISIRKSILCDSLEKTNTTYVSEWSLSCELQTRNNRTRCLCNKI